jgi:hypothetical protein
MGDNGRREREECDGEAPVVGADEDGPTEQRHERAIVFRSRSVAK